MTLETTRRLQSLQGRYSFYEVIAEKDGKRILIGYTQRRSRYGLLLALRARAAAVILLTECTEEDGQIVAGRRASDGFTVNGWTLRFSGRTARQAILEGEHEHINSVIKAQEVAA